MDFLILLLGLCCYRCRCSFSPVSRFLPLPVQGRVGCWIACRNIQASPWELSLLDGSLGLRVGLWRSTGHFPILPWNHWPSHRTYQFWTLNSMDKWMSEWVSECWKGRTSEAVIFQLDIFPNDHQMASPLSVIKNSFLPSRIQFSLIELTGSTSPCLCRQSPLMQWLGNGRPWLECLSVQTEEVHHAQP